MNSASSLPPETRWLNMMLVGKTGSGKSSTGNTILQDEVFDTSGDFEAATADCCFQKRTFGHYELSVTDTPGLFDAERSHEEIGVIIVKAVISMHPGIDAVLYVIKHDRYTAEEYAAYTRFKMLFGSDVTKHTIIVFTGGDGLKAGTDFDEVLKKSPNNLCDVLDDCNWRYVILNNMAPDRQDQVQKLLDLVSAMSDQNSGRPYVCSTYSKIGETLDEQVGKIGMREIEKQEAKTKQYFQEKEEKIKHQEEMNLLKANHERELKAVHARMSEENRRMMAEWDDKLKREEGKRQELEATLHKVRDHQAEQDKRHQMDQLALMEAAKKSSSSGDSRTELVLGAMRLAGIVIGLIADVVKTYGPPRQETKERNAKMHVRLVGFSEKREPSGI